MIRLFLTQKRDFLTRVDTRMIIKNIYPNFYMIRYGALLKSVYNNNTQMDTITPALESLKLKMIFW